MARGCNEVEKDVDSIVAETWVTLDTGLLCENIIVLSFKEANNLAKASSQLAVLCG